MFLARCGGTPVAKACRRVVNSLTTLVYRARFMPARASDGDGLKEKKSDGLDTHRTHPHTHAHVHTW